MPILNLIAENDCQQAIKDYLEQNASAILAEKINNGVKIQKDGKTLLNKKTLSQFWEYASRKATEMKTGYVKNETVFGWAIHFFEESDVEGTLYNEDGSEYKPVSKTIQRTPAPILPTKPPVAKNTPSQFSLFDLIEKKEEPKTEIVTETDETDDDEQEEELTEMNVDMETGEILNARPIEYKPNSLYQKYLSFQGQYPHAVIAYRLGDFYEVFGDNAIKVSNRLDLTLTGRDCGLPERVPMIGFPYHASDTYFRKIAEFSQFIVVEDDTATPYVLEEKAAIKTPTKEENEPTVYENNDEIDDFEEECALKQFFDKDALCALYELFDYNLDMQ